MTPTPITETVDQAVVDQAQAILAACATPEGVRGIVELWRNGNDTRGAHNVHVGSLLSRLVDLHANDIAAGCARSVADHQQILARWRRRQSVKQRVRVLAGGRPKRRPQADRPMTHAHPHLHLQPLA